ncbi:MAG: hypothetical protein ACUVUH_09730 [bacterium]
MQYLVKRLSIILFIIFAQSSYAQYLEEKEFELRLIALGNLAFILHGDSARFNIYQFDNNPVDLIGYISGKNLLQIAHWFYKGYPYFDVIDPSSGVVNQYATYYFIPAGAYFYKPKKNFAMGITSKSRIASYADFISPRYNYAFFINLGSNRISFGNATKCIIIKPSGIISKPEPTLEWQEQATFLLNLDKINFGPGVTSRINCYPGYVNHDWETPFYVRVQFYNFEALTMFRYYFYRPFRPTVWEEKVQGYDFNHRARHRMKLRNTRFSIGLALNYRRTYKLSNNLKQVLPSVFNAILGFSMDLNKVVLANENVIIKQGEIDKWLVRPKLGIEILLSKKTNIQLGISFAEEPYTGSVLEFEQTIYNWQPIYHYQDEISVNYSLGLSHLISSNIYLQYLVGFHHIPEQPLKLLFNLSMSSIWQ